MRSLILASTLMILSLTFASAQTAGPELPTFTYELDIYTIQDDAFHVKLYPPPLSPEDDVYSFVSYAPGAHQPLDFGRFVKSLNVFGLAVDMQPGDPFEIEIFRGDENLTFTGELVEKTEYHVFEVDENATQKQVKLREAWIGVN